MFIILATRRAALTGGDFHGDAGEVSVYLIIGARNSYECGL